jgi:DNA polymerase-3 subunit gamma/tau
MAVLYRKYRPQTFADVLNQKYIIQTLKNQVKSGGISHAYLFTGSRGVGKTSVARILAKAVNCQSADKLISKSASQQLEGEACGTCEVCKQIEQGSFLDLIEIDAASNTGVDNIRELIDHVRFSPSMGKYKVFIIDEVHMLSKGAFNALLKTLEEPPKHAIFILATTEINKVPATIVSRTQRFDFKALSAADLLGHLQKISEQENLKFEPAILELVAQNAEGSVRDALSLLDKLITLGSGATLEDGQQLLGITDIAVCEELLGLIAGGRAESAPEFFDKLSEKGLDFTILNRDFLEYLRKALVFKITGGAGSVTLSEDHKVKLAGLAEKLTVLDLMFVVRLFLRSYKDLDTSPSQQIPLLLSAIEAALRKSEGRKPEAGKGSSVVIKEADEKPSAQEIKAPVTESVVTDDIPGLSLEELEKFWPKVIGKIRDINGPLASMLKGARLQAVNGHKIILEVKFLFDKQNLESQKNIAVITDILQSVCGQKLGISAQVIKQVGPDQVSAAAVLTDALKVFGGELVE